MKCALVVDDESLLRRQVKETLMDYGFDEVFEAENGSLAVDLAQAKKPLLTVMDVSMPVMDGITAAEKMCKNPSGPVVLLTASGDSDTINRAREAGVTHFLMKPFRDDQIRATIDMAIHQFIEISNLKDEVTKLKETLETRKLVDRAKGSLMKQQGISEPEAYRKMQKLAMDKRKSLKEVADAILLMEG